MPQSVLQRRVEVSPEDAESESDPTGRAKSLDHGLADGSRLGARISGQNGLREA